MTEPLLWHIPISHFNEKVRWALDYKRIAHRRKCVGPDYLFQAWRKTGHGTLPILFLDNQPVRDSTAIIAELEKRWPEPALYPADEAGRREALALEDFFDEELGPQLRASVVTPLFRHDPDIALRLLTTGMPPKAYQTLRPLAKVFPVFYRFRHKIRDDALEQDQAKVLAAMDRIEAQRGGRDYLVGNAFSVADLTAASMFAPALWPPGLQYVPTVELPAYLAEFRDRIARHPTAQWVMETYRRHRGVSAELPRPARA